MKAVIYARYSSHSQREESIEGQIRECTEYAERNDMTIVGEYCDYALTGKVDTRPQFQKLIRDCEKGRFDAVIMYTLDRFARNRYDSAIYKGKLRKNGVKIFYAKQPMPETPEGIILESVLEGYAEYYSENLSRNIKRGLKENALHGYAMGATPPLGYKINKETKCYEIDPVGAKAVRYIFENYAAGKSSTEIINELNAMGFKTSRGNAFNKNSVRQIVLNDKYIGVYRYMDVVKEDGMPSIVSKELFSLANEKLGQNAKWGARKKATEEFLLITKLFCGHCGEPMVGESGTSKTGKSYFYYKCATQKRHKGTCDKKTVKKDYIEELVVKETVNRLLVNENIEKIAEKVIEIINKDNEENSVLLSLQKSLQDTEKKIGNLLKAVEDGMYTESMKNRLDDLEKDRKTLEANIAREEVKKPNITKEHIIYWLESFKKGDITDKKYQRQIIDTLVNAVFLFDEPGGKRIEIAYNISGHNREILSYPDIDKSIHLGSITDLSAPLNQSKSNTIFYTKMCVILRLFVEEV